MRKIKDKKIILISVIIFILIIIATIIFVQSKASKKSKEKLPVKSETTVVETTKKEVSTEPPSTTTKKVEETTKAPYSKPKQQPKQQPKPKKSNLPAGLFKNKLSDSQNSAALKVAQQIADSIPKNWTDEQKLDKATEKVNVYYNNARYTMEGPYYAEAYGVFVAKEASCAGACRALGLVVQLMGYKWRHVNENQYSHQWVQVYVNGEWKDYDAGITWL